MINLRLLILACILLQSMAGICMPGNTTISILTLEPGDEVYTVFGHTAIRISSQSGKIDKVYNFGTFDFSDPYFYLKFIRGNLRYFLSVDDYSTFIRHSLAEQRSMYEQVLALSENEKLNLYLRLENCYHSPERFYTYDFFHDNCATRVRDAIFSTRQSMVYDTSQYRHKTFRQLLEPYIADKYWLNLGINLALGREADKIASTAETMFLPAYIRDLLSKTGVVEREQTLIDASSFGKKHGALSRVSPWIIVVVLTGLSLWRRTRNIAFYTVLSAIGFIGMVILILEFVSENTAFSDNLNAYWTIPSLMIVFLRKKPHSEILVTAYLVVLTLMLLMWNHLPQAFSVTFIPWVLVIIAVLLLHLPWAVRSIPPQSS
jgi:hypothetical protein